MWAAADVTSGRIRTMQHLDHEHLMKIVAWRVGAETEARRTMPRQIPAQRKRALHRKFASERLDLVTERGAASRRLTPICSKYRRPLPRSVRPSRRLARALTDSAETRTALEASAEHLRAWMIKHNETRNTVLQEVQMQGRLSGIRQSRVAALDVRHVPTV